MMISLANEIADKLLPDARKWVRRSSAKLDDEIRQTIAACVLDMRNAGIIKIAVDDPLIQQAAKLYLKAQFGYDDKSEKWMAAYEHLKAALSLSSEYTSPASDTGGG